MLEFCTLLEKRAQSEKIDFLKKTGVCFGCLCTGHISKECRKRLSCKTCGLRHPSMLHIHHKDKEADVEKGKRNSESAVGSSLVTVQTSGLTGARHCTSKGKIKEWSKDSGDLCLFGPGQFSILLYNGFDG